MLQFWPYRLLVSGICAVLQIVQIQLDSRVTNQALSLASQWDLCGITDATKYNRIAMLQFRHHCLLLSWFV